MLTPGQYELLLKDSQLAVPHPESKSKPKPPIQVVIREANFTGEIEIGGDVVLMTADYQVESFTDDWAEIPLSLPRTRLAHIEVDAESALRVTPPSKGQNPRPLLVVKGRGKHTVKAIYHLPVKRSPSGNAISVASPGIAAASLALTLPEGAELDSALPFTTGEKDPNTARFVLPAQPGQNFEIRWTARNVAEIPDAAVFQNCQYLYSIDSSRVQADLGLVLNSNLTKLPNRFEIEMPEDVRVLSVEGSEMLRWTRLEGGAVEVVLVPGERDVTDLRVLAEADVNIQGGADEATVALPFVDVKGVHRASGTMALIGSDDVRVKNISTGPLTAPIPDDVEGAIANHPHYVAAFRFPVAAEAPAVTFSKIGKKFKAQMDTLVALERESIRLSRVLTLIPDEGRTFEIDFTLPVGEELLDVKDGTRQDFSWVRGEGNSIRLQWKAGLVAGSGDTLTVTSRRDPEGWFTLGDEPIALEFESAVIEGGDALSGYVVIEFDESFRVETVTAEGLDSRDSRTTPINGTLAWFRLTDYSLALNASRRATEIEAAHTAYALPLASNLEIEGQIDLGIRYTPIGGISVEFPPAMAAQARFDSPLIAHKNLDADSGTWALTFHDELIGVQRIRYRMSLPFEVEEVTEGSEQKRFEIALPVVKIPAAKRLRGEWVMEANTDTELEFEANGLDAVDSLHVGQVEGYQPRHRVIGAYRYRGDAWSLKLAGTRHAHEELVSTVIDSLRIDTVVSTDGDDRHQAAMSLRTSGEQFLEIGLPGDAVLWTLKIDGNPVKPVRSEPGTLRVQLPAHENASNRPIDLKLIYQTPGKKWSGSGKEHLDPIRVADRIPVMRTQWFLHLPEGYDYQKFESNLTEEFEVVDRTLLGYAGDELRGNFSRFYPATMVASALDESSADLSRVGAEGELEATKSKSVSPSEPMAESHRNQTRSTFKQEIAEGWEIPVPAGGAGDAFGGDADLALSNDSVANNENKLKRIILPSVEFADTPLIDALNILQQRSVELDVAESDPAKKGVNFILDVGAGGGAPPAAPAAGSAPAGNGFGIGGGVGDTRITLKLKNVPLVEAIRYTTSLAQLKYKVEPNAVLIVPLSRPDETLVTRRYKVPQTFMTQSMGGGGGAAAAADPFADPVDSGGGGLSARPTARSVLESAGVSFPAGGSASYDPGTGELLVRTSPDQLALTEEVVTPLGAVLPVTPATPNALNEFGNPTEYDPPELPNQIGNGANQSTNDFFGQRAIDQINPEWRDVPVLDQVPTIGRLFQNEAVVVSDNRVALSQITLDDLDLRGKSLEEALGIIREKTLAEGAEAGPIGTHGGTSRSKLVTFVIRDEEKSGPSGVDPALKNKLDLKLSNVTVLEALEEISKASDTHYRVTPDGIAFAPKEVTLEPMQTIFIELPVSEFQINDGNGDVRLAHARGVLKEAGIKFPAGSSAAYNPATGRLAVRNTRGNLEAVASHYASFLNVEAREAHAAARAEVFERDFLGGAADLKGFNLADIGRLPIDFVLPESGRSYSFAGLYAPEPIEFRFVNWERQIRFAWVWILVGGLMFWFGAYRRLGKPIAVGLLGIIVLTFLPLVISKSLLAFCNALLIGWLVAAVIWIGWRWANMADRKKEVAV